MSDDCDKRQPVPQVATMDTLNHETHENTYNLLYKNFEYLLAQQQYLKTATNFSD